MSRSRWLQLRRFVFNSRLSLAVILTSFFQLPDALAVDTHVVEVTENNGIYHIKASAVVEAPANYIRDVLTDYVHIYRLSPSIIESEVLPSSPVDEKQVRTRLLCCTSVFCKEVERVDVVRTLESGELQAEIIPALSEFKSGKATWKITPVQDRSQLVYEAHLEPDFFIPPIVGTQMVIDNLHDEFSTTFKRVEKIARINAERDWDTEHLLADVASTTRDIPCPKNINANMR